MKFAAPLLF